MARRESHSFVLFIIIIGHILASRIAIGMVRARNLEGGGKGNLGDVIGSNTSCPDYCHCHTYPHATLTIHGCSKDPGDDLDDIILDNRNTTTLDISNCHLSTLPTAVCKLNRLQALYLTNNQLLDLPWACLHKMDTLMKIRARNNNFSVLRNGVLYGFKQLSELNMSMAGVISAKLKKTFSLTFLVCQV